MYKDADFKRLQDTKEKDHDHRSPFRRDLARIIHSVAFRRLQRKTQLFPSDENDFFRNRLTHSLEVAQIATGIAHNLNNSVLKGKPQINEDLVHLAALAHDIGHPPFGHQGEQVLDGLMVNLGGFEGNAQTLRILSKIEKKETVGFPSVETASKAEQFDSEGERDLRLGLNLTMRSLASILKYDREIPETKEECDQKKYRRPVKGYFDSEKDLVKEIKKSVAPGYSSSKHGRFKTIECSIMDLADDIAYSTYDLEDAFKAQFLSPLEMVGAPADLKQEIATEINLKMSDEYDGLSQADHLTVAQIDKLFQESLFYAFIEDAPTSAAGLYKRIGEVHLQSKALADNGYYRTDFTSKLVNLFISGIQFNYNDAQPALNYVKFDLNTFKMVEVLKKFAYKSLIMSPRLKMAENRAGSIITMIFETLKNADEGRRLLPDDWRHVYFARGGEKWRSRVICDFIACMTDRYCVEFYSRLVGIQAPSIYKPF